MPRTISNFEMRRRQVMANATQAITNAMDCKQFALTPLEWSSVLLTVLDRIVSHGLREETKMENTHD